MNHNTVNGDEQSNFRISINKPFEHVGAYLERSPIKTDWLEIAIRGSPVAPESEAHR